MVGASIGSAGMGQPRKASRLRCPDLPGAGTTSEPRWSDERKAK